MLQNDTQKWRHNEHCVERCAQFRNESIDSAMICMYNAIKVIDSAMIIITYDWILNESRLRGHEINYSCILDGGIRADSSRFGFPRPASLTKFNKCKFNQV